MNFQGFVPSKKWRYTVKEQKRLPGRRSCCCSLLVYTVFSLPPSSLRHHRRVTASLPHSVTSDGGKLPFEMADIKVKWHLALHTEMFLSREGTKVHSQSWQILAHSMWQAYSFTFHNQDIGQETESMKWSRSNAWWMGCSTPGTHTGLWQGCRMNWTGQKPLEIPWHCWALQTMRKEGKLAQPNISSFVSLRSCSKALCQLKNIYIEVPEKQYYSFWAFPPLFHLYSLSSVSFMVPLCCSQFSLTLNWWKKVLFCEGVEKKERKKKTTVIFCIRAVYKAVIHRIQHLTHMSGQKVSV